MQPHILNDLLQTSSHLRELSIDGIDISWLLLSFLNSISKCVCVCVSVDYQI